MCSERKKRENVEKGRGSASRGGGEEVGTETKNGGTVGGTNHPTEEER